MKETTPARTPTATRSPERAGSHPVGTGVGALLGGAAPARPRAPSPARSAPLSGCRRCGRRWPRRQGHRRGDDPTREDAYWRDNYASRPYVDAGASYDDFGPAYAYGVTPTAPTPAATGTTSSPSCRSLDVMRGRSTLDWDRAKHATRDAWDRVSDAVERAVPGDSDRDGK